MLRIEVPEQEFFDAEKERFFTTSPIVLELEHSLLSVSKWEAIWGVPFLNDTPKTSEQDLSYIECMSLVDPANFKAKNLPVFVRNQIADYIASARTATTITERKPTPRVTNREQVTSELIYYWMVSFGIPFEAETWFLNRLIMLIRVAGVKQQKQTASKPNLKSRRALNEARRAQLGTTG